MTINEVAFEVYLEKLADTFEPEELVVELGLSIWDLIEAFRERLEERPIEIEHWRYE